MPRGEALFEALQDCPPGDRNWVFAFAYGRRTRQLPKLEQIATGLDSACATRWQVSWLLAKIASTEGELAQAKAHANEAVARATTQGDEVGLAWSRNRLGWLQFQEGALADAEHTLQLSAEGAERLERFDIAAAALNSLAGVALERGELANSRERLLEARAALAVAVPSQLPSVDLNIAVHTMHLGNARAAEKQLLELYEGQDSDTWRSLAANLLGNLYRRLGQLEKAESWYGRVGEMASLKGYVELSRGLISMRRGEFELAQQRFRRALNRAANPMEQHLARAFAARAAFRVDRSEQSLADLTEVVRSAEEREYFEPLWQGLWMRAQIYREQGDLSQAERDLEQAVKVLEQTGQSLSPISEGLRYLVDRKGPYHELAALKVAKGDEAAGELLRTQERLHARALSSRFRSSNSDAPHASLADLRLSLPPDSMIVSLSLGESEGAMLAVSAEGASVHRLPGIDELARPMSRWRAALVRPLLSAEARLDPLKDLDRSRSFGEALSLAILQPLEDKLRRVERIYFIADDALHRIPLQTLPWPLESEEWSFLGESHEIALLPRVGFGPAAMQPDERPVLLAGDPLPDAAGAWPRLDRAGDELEALRRVYGARATSRSGRDLTPAKLLELPLTTFGTIHLATHAEASTADPSRCAVRLSRGEAFGFDRVAELELDDALVVLSACQSGEGEVIPGEGVVGLSWAFMRSGASAVTSSLWSVDDGAAASLMGHFHRELRERDPVAALAYASRRTQQSYPHPAFWSPFALMLRPSPSPSVR